MTVTLSAAQPDTWPSLTLPHFPQHLSSCWAARFHQNGSLHQTR